LIRNIINGSRNTTFRGSAKYWEKRYRRNGTSGSGSYGKNAEYKANFLNRFVNEQNIESVIEFGCGDGNQLKQFTFSQYIGLDVSVTAIRTCIDIFITDPTKSFFLYNPAAFIDRHPVFKADLSLSLDVVYHLTEDEVFERYMQHLFSSSARFVIIYAWDVDGKRSQHVRHRQFTRWIEENLKEWHLIEKINNGKPEGACDFFIYEKRCLIDNG
jgi:hypothetical protein